jgi:hypothetical protein
MSESDDDKNDVLYMTDRRRTYIEPHTGDLLFLEWSTHDDGWIPAKATMTAWQQGHLRIYYPTDIPNPTLITMPGAEQWPLLRDTEEPDVRAVMARPWIPDGQVMEGVREQDIAILERQYDFTASAAAADEALEASRVPMLVMTMTYDLVPVVRPTAPPPTSQTGRTNPLKPFPRHLVAAILANATTNKATCPITLEPITPDRATVTSCGHVFQTEAIRYWLTTHNECPECREPTCI